MVHPTPRPTPAAPPCVLTPSLPFCLRTSLQLDQVIADLEGATLSPAHRAWLRQRRAQLERHVAAYGPARRIR